MKFGGLTLGTAKRIASSVAVIKAAGPEVVVVVSAIGGVTDRLHLACDISASPGDITATMAYLRKTHLDLAPPQEDLTDVIDPILTRLERILFGIVYVGELTPRTRDRVVSAGERLSSLVVAAALRAAGVPALALSVREAGIRTDSEYGSATIDIEASRQAAAKVLRPTLEGGTVPVVPGYYGITPGDHVATLGRSGTDYSATAVGAILGAEVIEVWKTVPGFMAADPDLIGQTHVIPNLSYDEAAELAYFGAQVIHPRAVDPARQAGIPIHIRSVDEPMAPGTLIATETELQVGAIKSISYRRGLSVLKVFGSGAGLRQGTLAAIATTLGDQDINILSATTSQTCIALLIESSDGERARAAMAGLAPGLMERTELGQSTALVCAVGHGLSATHGIAGRVFSAIAEEDINVDMISAGASEVAYHFTVSEADLPRVIRLVHDEFFGSNEEVFPQ